MKTYYGLHVWFIPILLAWIGISTCHAQMARMSFNKAYGALNPSTKSTSFATSPNSNYANAMEVAKTANYTKKVQISYGIPIEILFEYAIVKSNLASDMAGDPDTYNNSRGDVQQAFVNLAYGDFVKISDYKKVNVKLNFRFNPARLVNYGSDESDFVNNTQSSPWDVAVYKTPNTPVSGTKIMVIQK
jgi:hypothetical protein